MIKEVGTPREISRTQRCYVEVMFEPRKVHQRVTSPAKSSPFHMRNITSTVHGFPGMTYGPTPTITQLSVVGERVRANHLVA
jgi:hypothetical protein